MIKRIVILAVCIITAHVSVAQPYTSRLGRFQVDQIKGCAPFTITITNADINGNGDCTPGKPCLMDFQGNNQSQQNAFTFTYTTPGTFKLSVLYQSIGADDIMVTVDEDIPPPFEIYTCSGNRVSIKVTDNHYDQYVIDFDNDDIPETIIPFTNNAVAQHSYPAAGNYSISIQGRNLNSDDNCTAMVQPFTARPSLTAPTLNSITTLNATSVQLGFNPQPNFQYRLEIAVNNSNTFQVMQTLYGVNTVTVPNLLTDNNFYCFRLSAYDPCANANLYSNIICSQDFDVAFQNGANVLTWKTSPTGITSVEIKRDQAAYTTIPGGPLTFSDKDYDCNTNYCYQVIMHYGALATSTSLEKCGTSILQVTHPSILNVSAVVGDGVALTWQSDPLIKIKEFEVWRSTKGGGVALYSTAPATTQNYTDKGYQTAGEYCYEINYTDLCFNPSAEGILACPIRLNGSMDAQNVATISWNEYTGWENGVASYVVEKYDAQGALLQSTNVGTDLTYVDAQEDLQHQVVTFKIRALSADGQTPSISNALSFRKDINLTFPTAFTPNQDALNELFTITGHFVSKMSITIFDRWGVIVFSSDKNEPWNGTRNDIPMPESSYIWKAEITDLTGQTFSREGTLMLLRP